MSVANFPSSAIPIVGQAFTPRSGFITAVISCNCDGASTEVLLIAGFPQVCRRCGRKYMLAAGSADHTTGQLQLKVAIVNEAPQAPGVPS
jgi:hypothetical protein